MKLRLLFIFSVLLLTKGYAQQADSTIVRPVRSGIEFSVDYGKIFTLPSDFESKWEVGIGYRYKSKIVLCVQAGTAKLEPNAYENGTYQSTGQYATAGLNYLIPMDATSTLYLGAQYGISMYEDEYSYAIGSPVWPDLSDADARTNLEADWYGLVLGSEKRLNNLSGLIVGFEFNLRILRSYEEFEPIDTYAIPGYGRTSDGTIPAVNVYLKYLLEL